MSDNSSPRFVPASATRKVLDPTSVLQVVESSLRSDAAGNITWPEPRNLNIAPDRSGNEYHLKACVLEDQRVAGARIVAHQSDESKGNSTRLILLINAVTSLPLAIVDDSWTYQHRTAANALLALRNAAIGSVARVGLVGTGRIAWAALPYIGHLFPDSEVVVSSRREESRQEFVRRASAGSGLAIRASKVRDSVERSDVVLVATGSPTAVIDDAWVSPGAAIACLETAECGSDLFWNADLRIVDSRRQLESELTELYGQEAPGAIEATMSDLVSGAHEGRTDPQQRILLISQGLVSQDVALAFRAYESLQVGAEKEKEEETW